MAKMGNKNAIGNKGGNPGYGHLEFIRKKVKKHSVLWWKEWEQMMKSKPDEFINDNVKDLISELIKRGEGYTAKEIIKDLAKGAFYRKQFAMTEYNKLQAKLLPTQLSSEDGNPLIIKFDGILKVAQQTKGNNPKPSEV